MSAGFVEHSGWATEPERPRIGAISFYGAMNDNKETPQAAEPKAAPEYARKPSILAAQHPECNATPTRQSRSRAPRQMARKASALQALRGKGRNDYGCGGRPCDAAVARRAGQRGQLPKPLQAAPRCQDGARGGRTSCRRMSETEKYPRLHISRQRCRGVSSKLKGAFSGHRYRSHAQKKFPFSKEIKWPSSGNPRRCWVSWLFD